MNKQDLLKLNLQFFAEDDNDNETNIDEKNPSDETLNTEEQEKDVVDKRIPYERFKAKVDEANALKEELARLREAQEAAERAKLEEQNEFKALYEKAQEDLAKLKADALNAKKDALLTQAGYNAEQIAVLRNTLVGENDEELTKGIEDLKAVIPPKPKYIDPSPLGGGDGKPRQVGADEVGTKMFQRIKNKIF